jgi:hypothetical protein
MATDTMFEYMGVRVDPVDELGEVALRSSPVQWKPAGKVTRGRAATRWTAGSTTVSAH